MTTVRSIILVSIVTTTMFCGPKTANAWDTLSLQTSLGDCGLSEPHGGGLVEIDVLLLFDGCAQDVVFRVVASEGFTGTYVGQTSDWGSCIGNAVDGVWIYNALGSEGGASVLTIQYMTYGTSDQCSRLYVAPHPDYSGVFVYDCYGLAHDITEHSAWFTFWVGGSFNCSLGTCTPEIVGTQATTWGRIKAMYGN